MSATTTTIGDTRFSHLPTAEQVRRAMPLAQRILEFGFNHPYDDEDLNLRDHVAALTGEDVECLHSSDDDENWTISNRLEAARAIGIALGLMLRPEAFDLKGGK